MEDERTILDTQNGNNQNVNNSQKKTGIGEKAAYAAGGAVFGAGATLAGQTIAARKEEDMPVETIETEATAEQDNVETEVAAPNDIVSQPTENGVTIETASATVHVNGNATVSIDGGPTVHVNTMQETLPPTNTPTPEESIVATATGVRVAQVDDEASFSQAFADARRQVGPGGVFEWRGRVYGTYYKDEWDNMSSEERAEYHASIDYKDVVNHDNDVRHHSDMAQNNSHQSHSAHETTYAESAQQNHETNEDVASNDDVEIQVLEVGQTDLNNDGIPENAAVLDVNGHEVLIVDIDQDGIADILLADNNGNGYLDEGEAYDLRGENIAMPNMTSGDMYMAQNDGPDYMNDADVNQYV